MQITKDGKPVSQIHSEKQTSIKDEGLAFLKLVNIAERDISSGRVMTLDEALKALIEE